MIRDLEYIVNVVVIVDTPTEKEARQYVERHLRGITLRTIESLR
jgi:hypothetical protein